jgi:hypothetical protein
MLRESLAFPNGWSKIAEFLDTRWMTVSQLSHANIAAAPDFLLLSPG